MQSINIEYSDFNKKTNFVEDNYKFEPIVALKDYTVLGYETLSRSFKENWVDHDLKTLDVIHDIDLYMAKKVFSDACYLNINLSSESILNISDLTIEKASEKRPAIVIEWVEDRCSSSTILKVSEKLKRWREQFSIKVALDDMGKGQDAYERFLSIKPDFAKIDGTILHGARSSSSYMRAMRSYCNFCNEENVPVIVEWIESQKDIDIALSCHATYGQGFFIQAQMDAFNELNS